MKEEELSILKEQLVRLNVGGTRYTTTLTTLTSQGTNFLSQLIENERTGKLATTKDDTGAYFVDRNGTLFQYVLDYLRTGDLLLPSESLRKQVSPRDETFFKRFFSIDYSKKKVLREMDFYSIEYKCRPSKGFLPTE